MIDKKDITGIILAGGQSSRMGRDKALLSINGKRFMQCAIDALNPLVNEIIIVSNHSAHDVFNLKRVNDLIENAGPLAGLCTGLHYSKTKYNLVMSCDIPLVDTNFLMRLTKEPKEDVDVIQVESKGKTMPLVAFYKTRCKDKCLELLEKGERRLRMAIDQLNAETVTLNKDEVPYVENINTPEQLKAIIHEAHH